MSVLTLELENDADLELLISFAKRLNASIVEITDRKIDKSQDSISWLEQLALKGGVKSIPNPSEWQREMTNNEADFIHLPDLLVIPMSKIT